MPHLTLKHSKACAKERLNFNLYLQRQINQCIKEGRGEKKNDLSLQTLL